MILLPYRNQNPPESWPIATILLIVFNTTFFFLTSKFGLVIKPDVATEYGLSWANFAWYQIFTSMFLHGDIMHLLGNMFFLYLMGFAVEGRLRTWKFLLLYFVAGLVGSGLHMLVSGTAAPKIPVIGASGAIMGVMGASMYMFPHAPVDVFWWFFYRIGTMEWRMWHVGLMYICFDLLDIFLEILSGTPGGTANFAHLGGVAAGAFICWVLRAVRDDERVAQAKATLHQTNDVSLLHEKELRDLYAVNPTRPDVALHWMVKSSFTNQQTSTYPEAVKAFHQQFNGILDTQPMHLVNQVVNGMLLNNPQLISIQQISRVAAKAEKEGHYAPALQFYQKVVHDPRSSATDVEGASFRIAMLYESAFNDLASAKQWYEYIAQAFPMSPVMTQVNTRLTFIRGKLQTP